MKLVTQLLERLQPRVSTRGPERTTPQNPDIARIIHDALDSAGLGKTTARGAQIGGVIDDALARAGLMGAGDPMPGSRPVERELETPVLTPPVETNRVEAGSIQGRFLTYSFTAAAGTLNYKLYLPASYNPEASTAAPLLVMLHGCTQSPDDFAAGTRMNALADVHGFLVAYPAQSANANGSKCWNWFRPQDQARGAGEPAMIAGMTAQISAEYRVDPSRVYVAGLSAGAAMAVVLGATYPDVFAAVGAHSGLPYRAAKDVGSAFAVMRSGASGTIDAAANAGGTVMPTIVFHGDRDQTVSAVNGDAIVARMTGIVGRDRTSSTHDSGSVAGGRNYVRTTYTDEAGQAVIEDWRVHGGGHAWMGGSASGSYTDPSGPDASAEMVRFFLQHTR